MLIDDINGEYKILKSGTNEAIPSDGMVIGYFGERKIRQLVSIPGAPTDHSLDLLQKLKRFDRIIGIDTNSRQTQDRWIHIGSAVHLAGFQKDDQIEWRTYPINRPFILVGERAKPENENWKGVIEYVRSHKNYRPEHRVALVVDSDLGNLPSYNRREAQIVDGYILPEGFELVYASDRANETVLNKLIQVCHAIADKYLEHFPMAIVTESVNPDPSQNS